jgi:hypothetical protein
VGEAPHNSWVGGLGGGRQSSRLENAAPQFHAGGSGGGVNIPNLAGNLCRTTIMMQPGAPQSHRAGNSGTGNSKQAPRIFINSLTWDTRQLRNSKIRTLRNSKTQKLRNSETRKLGNSETQKLGNSETEKLRNSETRQLNNSETRKLRKSDTQQLRNS